jgi:hypothetical protein
MLGYRRGWGNSFRGLPNQGNIFHLTVPSLNLEDHAATNVIEIQLAFATTNTARVTTLHVWDGPRLIQQHNGLNAGGSFLSPVPGKNAFLYNPALNVQQGLGLSVFVQFGARVSDVLFASAYALFST